MKAKKIFLNNLGILLVLGFLVPIQASSEDREHKRFVTKTQKGYRSFKSQQYRDFETQVIEKSKISGFQYLGLTSQEVKKKEEIVNLLLIRSNKVCLANGFASALDFQLERSTANNKEGVLFSSKNGLEIIVKQEKSVKGWSVAIDVALFAITGGIGSVLGAARGTLKGIAVGAVVVGSEVAISYGFHLLTREKIKEAQLNNWYTTSAGLFKSIDCVVEKEHSEYTQEDIIKIHDIYSCQLKGYKNCRKGSPKFLNCLAKGECTL